MLAFQRCPVEYLLVDAQGAPQRVSLGDVLHEPGRARVQNLVPLAFCR
jgi:hypothetical protein